MKITGLKAFGVTIDESSDRPYVFVKIETDADRSLRWVDPVRILEAKKDGVLLRPLKETLRVDAVAVLRQEPGAGCAG